MEKLKGALMDFRQLTLDLIESMSAENYEALEKLFEKRQQVIEKIDKLPFDHVDFIAIAKELDLLELDSNLNRMIASARVDVKTSIDKLSEHKIAKNGYTKGFSVESIFYNKKI